ncbi:MAG: hypothetical protein KDK97_24515, partial [Verrucomicrobiales bacterium]|nr:hypothetical protein [Verrucomicrobiales bacterium]
KLFGARQGTAKRIQSSSVYEEDFAMMGNDVNYQMVAGTRRLYPLLLPSSQHEPPANSLALPEENFSSVGGFFWTCGTLGVRDWQSTIEWLHHGGLVYDCCCPGLHVLRGKAIANLQGIRSELQSGCSEAGRFFRIL